MVHQKLISEGKVQPLTFSQLKRLENIDKKKAVEIASLEVASQGFKTIGDLARAAGTILTGPVGLVAGFELVRYLNNVATLPDGTHYVVKANQIVTTGIISGYTGPIGPGLPPQQPIYVKQPVYLDKVVAGPFDTLDQANQALADIQVIIANNLISSAYAPGTASLENPHVVTYQTRQQAMDDTTALEAKAALLAAGLGSVLKTITGA